MAEEEVLSVFASRADRTPMRCDLRGESAADVESRLPPCHREGEMERISCQREGDIERISTCGTLGGGAGCGSRLCADPADEIRGLVDIGEEERTREGSTTGALLRGETGGVGRPGVGEPLIVLWLASCDTGRGEGVRD